MLRSRPSGASPTRKTTPRRRRPCGWSRTRRWCRRSFWFEIRNLLLVGERRGRIDAVDGARFLAHLDSLPLERDDAPSSTRLLTLARAHGLSAYDTAYLKFAQRRTLCLATLDRRLAAAATAEGLTLFGMS
jgi:predicted nucleic acid-binding protein